jgi:lipopolysaccharide export LptBFGC system permease protein LptF
VRILSRHALASYARLFLAVLVASLFALAIIEMLVNFDRIVERESGLRGIGTYLLLRIPSYYLPDLIPLASFAAAFLALGLPARRHEVTAMKAGGISPLRPALAILAGAAVLSAGALLAGETLIRACAREWIRPGPAAGVARSSGAAWYRRGDTVYRVGAVPGDARSLRDVLVVRLSPEGRPLESTRAEAAELADGEHWRLIGATRRRFDPSRPDAPPITRVGVADRLELAAAGPVTAPEVAARALSLAQLRQAIEDRRSQGRDATAERAALHGRLVQALAVLPLTLLAIPLGLAVERTRSLEVGALHGLAVIATFHGLRTIAAALASAGWTGAVWGPWIGLALLSGYGAWQLVRAPR